MLPRLQSPRGTCGMKGSTDHEIFLWLSYQRQQFQAFVVPFPMRGIVSSWWELIHNQPKSHKQWTVSSSVHLLIHAFIFYGEFNHLTLFLSCFSLQHNTVPKFIPCLAAKLQTLRSCQGNVLAWSRITEPLEKILAHKKRIKDPTDSPFITSLSQVSFQRDDNTSKLFFKCAASLKEDVSWTCVFMYILFFNDSTYTYPFWVHVASGKGQEQPFSRYTVWPTLFKC